MFTRLDLPRNGVGIEAIRPQRGRARNEARAPVNAFVTTTSAEGAANHHLLERFDGIGLAARQKRRADIGEIRAERLGCEHAAASRDAARKQERTAPPFANLADKARRARLSLCAPPSPRRIRRG